MTHHTQAGEGEAPASGISVEMSTHTHKKSLWSFKDKTKIQVCRLKQ